MWIHTADPYSNIDLTKEQYRDFKEALRLRSLNTHLTILELYYTFVQCEHENVRFKIEPSLNHECSHRKKEAQYCGFHIQK